MNLSEMLFSFLKIMSSLAVTVGLVILTVYLLKKIMHTGRGYAGGVEMIMILSSYHPEPKSSIMIVDVLGRIMVIGTSGGAMSMLAEITDPVSLERLKDIRKQKEKNTSFSDCLKSCIKRSGLDSKKA
jgi:flagellar biogenesis protein FliO